MAAVDLQQDRTVESGATRTKGRTQSGCRALDLRDARPAAGSEEATRADSRRLSEASGEKSHPGSRGSCGGTQH